MRDLVFFLVFLPLPVLSFFKPWIGMLLWGWLALMNPHRELWGFASSFPFNQLIAIPTLAGYFVSGQYRHFRLDLTITLLFLLWVLMTVSTFFSLAPELSWPKWNEFSKILLYAALLPSFLITRTRIHTLIWLCAGSIGYFGIQGSALFILTAGTHEFAGPKGSQIADRNHLALAILMVIPLMNYLRLQSPHLWMRRGLIAAMVLSVLAVVGTYSRGGFVGLVAIGAVLWWHSRQRLATIFGILLAAALVTHIAPDAWLERMQTIQTADQQDASFLGRLLAWQTYFAAAIARPLTGAGLYALQDKQVFFRYMPYESGLNFETNRALAAHSIYLQVIGELGFLSFAAYLTLVFWTWTRTRLMFSMPTHDYSKCWSNDLARMTQVSLIAFLVSGAALSIAFYDLFFILVATIAALTRLSACGVGSPRPVEPCAILRASTNPNSLIDLPASQRSKAYVWPRRT